MRITSLAGLEDFQVLTPKEAAYILGVHPRTLIRWNVPRVKRGPSGRYTGYLAKTVRAVAYRPAKL